MKKSDIDTPALLVGRRALRSNIEEMQQRANRLGVALRPHTKTHKSPRIARMQIEVGAKGVTVAKLGEAEVMAAAGVEDVLIANQIVGRHKMERLLDLARRVRLGVLVDSVEGVEILERAFARTDTKLDVMIEIDTGKARCGLRRLDDIVAVARAVVDAAHLRLRGLETHEGHVAGGAENEKEIESRATVAGERMIELASTLRSQGFEIDEVSVGSTPGAAYTATVSGITEMRPGTYVFNDVNQMAIGQATPTTCALSVLATVISRPNSHRAVLDAGSKTLFHEAARKGFGLRGYGGFGYIKQAPEARIASLSEEHGVVEIPDGSTLPEIGDTVEIIPNHVCACVNLHDEMLLIDGDEVVDVVPIEARGRIR